MADYVYDGRVRKITCTVDYKDGAGESITGYPVDYDITDAFTDPGAPLGGQGTPVSYSSITNAQLARMSDENYNTRLAAFYNFIENANEGLDRSQNVLPGFEPTGTSPVCVINDPAPDEPEPTPID